LPNKVNNRWPAIILADSRTARVPGRIIFLMDSINTINDIRADGVPWGTKWASMCLVKFNHPNSINESHKGNARDRVVTMWLVLVNTYGNKPKKLLNTIK